MFTISFLVVGGCIKYFLFHSLRPSFAEYNFWWTITSKNIYFRTLPMCLCLMTCYWFCSLRQLKVFFSLPNLSLVAFIACLKKASQCDGRFCSSGRLRQTSWDAKVHTFKEHYEWSCLTFFFLNVTSFIFENIKKKYFRLHCFYCEQ